MARQSEREQRQIAQQREAEATAYAQRAEREAQRARQAEADAQQRAEELELVSDFQARRLAEVDAALMGIGLRRQILDRYRAAFQARGVDEAAIEQQLSDLDQSLALVNFADVALETLDENIFEGALRAIDQQFADQPLIRALQLQTMASTMRELGRCNAPPSRFPKPSNFAAICWETNIEAPLT